MQKFSTCSLVFNKNTYNRILEQSRSTLPSKLWLTDFVHLNSHNRRLVTQAQKMAVKIDRVGSKDIDERFSFGYVCQTLHSSFPT